MRSVADDLRDELQEEVLRLPAADAACLQPDLWADLRSRGVAVEIPIRCLVIVRDHCKPPRAGSLFQFFKKSLTNPWSSSSLTSSIEKSLWE